MLYVANIRLPLAPSHSDVCSICQEKVFVNTFKVLGFGREVISLLGVDVAFERQNDSLADRSISKTSEDSKFSQNVFVSVQDSYYFTDQTFVNNNVWAPVGKVTHGSGVYHPHVRLCQRDFPACISDLRDRHIYSYALRLYYQSVQSPKWWHLPYAQEGIPQTTFVHLPCGTRGDL